MKSLMKSRKGLAFYLVLFLMTLSILVYSYYIIVLKTEGYSLTLGDEAVLMVGLLQRADNVQHYLDAASGYSAVEAFHKMAEGGFGENICGDYMGYPLWNNGPRKCLPLEDSTLGRNFFSYYNPVFTEFLDKYGSYGSLPRVFYSTLYLNGNGLNVAGTASEEMTLTLHEDSKSYIGRTGLHPVLKNLGQFNSGDTIILYEDPISGDYLFNLIDPYEEKPAETSYFRAAEGYWIEASGLDKIIAEINSMTDFSYTKVTRQNFLDVLTEAQINELIRRYPGKFISDDSLREKYGIKPDFSSIPFGFTATEDPGDKTVGIINLHDVWELAKKEDVNYHLVLAMIGTESSYGQSSAYRRNNQKGKQTAHGVMQMFKPATTDVFSSLKSNYPSLKNPEDAYDNVFTSDRREDVKVQVHAGILYLKWLKKYFDAKNINTDDVELIVQAYHDGIGDVGIKNGQLARDEYKYCKTKSPSISEKAKCSESLGYLDKVEDHYTKETWMS